MIKIENVSKSFEETNVLKSINIDIRPGIIYGLIGRSGVGKSTLLRCINGLIPYDKGRIIVDGIDINSLNENDIREFRKGVGMIFQQFSLLNRLSVYENVALPLQCAHMEKTFIKKRVLELLELMGLGDKIYASAKELSGGQKQRVAIARALTMSPKILLCDEATSALDPKSAKSITDLLNQINRELGITIIMVTHQMSVVKDCCDEITILENGEVKAQGNTKKIFLENPPALRNLIGEEDLKLPNEGVNMRVILSDELSDVPVITRMARSLDIDFVFIGGEQNYFKQGSISSVFINLKEQDYEKAANFLNEKKLFFEVIRGE